MITSNCSPRDEYRYGNASLIIQHVNSLPIKTCIKQSITLNDSIKHTERNFTVRTRRRAFDGGMTFIRERRALAYIFERLSRKIEPYEARMP